MRLAPHHLLLVLLGMAVLAGVSTLGTPPERTHRVATQRHPVQAPATTSVPDGWIWTSDTLDLPSIADDVEEATREGQVRAVGTHFIRETIMGRRPANVDGSLWRYRTWARTLPAITREGTTYVNLHHDRRSATLTTTLELWTKGYTYPGERATPHIIGTDVEFELELRQGTWFITRASYEREGLAAFRSPVVVRDGAVTVVADRDDQELAADIAAIAGRATRGIVAEYPGITRGGPVTVYLARSADASELIDHSPAQENAAAWVTHDSDIVMLGDAADRGPDDVELIDLVWHEMTHVVTAPIDDQLPSILNEGFADYVGTEAALRVPDIYMNYTDKAEAVRKAHYPYVRMLTGEYDNEFYDGYDNSELGYHLGHGTIAWIHEQRGDATLRRFLRVAGARGGVVAARQVLHMSPAQLGARAREWVLANEIVEH